MNINREAYSMLLLETSARPQYTVSMRGKQTSEALMQQIQSLRKAGLSLGEIRHRTGTAKSTISALAKSIILSGDQRESIAQRHSAAIVQANQLRRGQYRKHRIQPIHRWSEKIVECVAHFSFDGSVGRYAVSYSNRSTILIERQKKLVFDLYGLRPAIRVQPSGVTEIRFHSADLAEEIAGKERELRAKIEVFPRSWQHAYLRAFFDDEGNVDVPREGKRYRVRGYQYDQKLLVCIQRLLIRFQIPSRIDLRARAVVIQGSEQLRQFRKEINFSAGIYMNHKRSNSRYVRPIEKRALLQSIT